MDKEASSYINANSETPNDHDYETSFQCELDDILNYESDQDDDSEDALVIDEDCLLYQEDMENLDQEPHDLGIADTDITALFRYGERNVLRLTVEEEDVISKCTDLSLQRCLIQNRLKMAQLRDLYTKLVAVQSKCFLRKERESMTEQDRSKSPVILPPKTYIWKLGTPYFKDQNSYGAPPNTDYINKQQHDEFTLTHFSEGRRWVDEDQMILRNSVDLDYYAYCVFDLEQKMQSTERKIKNEDDISRKSELEAELAKLQKEMEELKAGPSYKTPPYKSKVGIDWFKISNQHLKGLHTINECKAMWNIYLHPHINKNDWTEEENTKIKMISEKYKYQDWDAIAEELGTNRSGYLICVHYYTKLCEKFRKDRFIPSEDTFLLEVIENCRLGSYIPWTTVANYFEDRSKHQLYHRYKYYLSYKNTIKKGLFSEAEDVLLAYLVNRFGKEYSKFAKYMPQRTTIQLRNRYATYLENITVNLGNFTVADDEKILKYVEKHGDKKWSVIARELKRTRAHVRQRYLTLSKWFKRGPDVTLEQIPRRKQQFLLKHQSIKQQRMNEILKKLQNSDKIPTLQQVEVILSKQTEKEGQMPKKWHVYTKKAALSPTDSKLLNHMKSVYKIRKETKLPSEHSARESALRTIRLLDILGMDVNILKDSEIANITDEYVTLTRNEQKIFYYMKQMLNEGLQLDISGSNAGPSTSTAHLSNLDQSIKHALPPSLGALVALRGLIVRYELYKDETNDSCVSRVRLASTKTALEDPLVWKIEQNLLRLDNETRMKIVNERNVIYERLMAIFKWPSVMSTFFPEQLEKEETVETHPPQNDIQILPKQVGRPKKKISDKILKMNEARKRKHVDNVVTNTSTATATIVTATTSTATTEEQPVAKKKRGPRAVKPIADYAVRYVPRRAKQKKIFEGEIIDLEDEEVDDVEEVSTLNKSTEKVIILDNIKLPSNVHLFDKNSLFKLDKPETSKQVLMLNSTVTEPEDVIRPPQKVIRVYQNKKKLMLQKSNDTSES